MADAATPLRTDKRPGAVVMLERAMAIVQTRALFKGPLARSEALSSTLLAWATLHAQLLSRPRVALAYLRSALKVQSDAVSLYKRRKLKRGGAAAKQDGAGAVHPSPHGQAAAGGEQEEEDGYEDDFDGDDSSAFSEDDGADDAAEAGDVVGGLPAPTAVVRRGLRKTATARLDELQAALGKTERAPGARAPGGSVRPFGAPPPGAPGAGIAGPGGGSEADEAALVDSGADSDGDSEADEDDGSDAGSTTLCGSMGIALLPAPPPTTPAARAALGEGASWVADVAAGPRPGDLLGEMSGAAEDGRRW
ncbi:hypothetical protein FNF29_00185 [Cafeteria roenbergensis]|uniref:Uncharacterized protein n=1 Tax=Cafeteria roenbergensis TaxID=33653 RepID=A0A5A8CY48_CAFRO|nr:hypothetical protein FNF29_00185 [Cafeteria roenbergensis]|eukprot:KAA0157609.1 hypothetical protein FNF29_00185 [Cafeteria roenbergensis]